MRELGVLLAVEASADLPLEVRPPDESGIVKRFPKSYLRPRHVLQHASRPVIITNVRSGLVMAEGVREIIPTPYQGHIGLVVRPKEVLPFMVTLPDSTPQRICIIVDPFIVGGTTAVGLIKILLDLQISPKNIRFVTACVSRKAHERLGNTKELHGVRFFCGRIDGVGPYVPDEDWIEHFEDLNERLFRTMNRDRAVIVPDLQQNEDGRR